MAQTVKRLSTMWETWVRSLGQEDPLEKEMAIHSSTIAWKIPWTEEPGRLQTMGSQRAGHDLVTSLLPQAWTGSELGNRERVLKKMAVTTIKPQSLCPYEALHSVLLIAS